MSLFMFCVSRLRMDKVLEIQQMRVWRRTKIISKEWKMMKEEPMNLCGQKGRL